MMTVSIEKMVICNLQQTPLDEEAELVIYEQCDTVMKLLMQELSRYFL